MDRMTPTQIKNAMIKQNAKAVDTAPEREMKGLLEELMIGYLFDQHTNVEALNREDLIQAYRFQLDFVIMDFSKPLWVVVIEVNGPNHVRSKDEWESKLMLDAYVEGTGYQILKVINFDAEYLRLKRYRPLAIKALAKALQSADRIVWVEA